VMRDFEDLVHLTDLGDEDESRLRRVHEMLVAAGPPSDLPIKLSRPVAVEGGEVVSLDEHRRRTRPLVAVAIAAAVAVACFLGGYVIATQAHSNSSAIDAVRVVPMQGVAQNSFASLRVGSSDENGNWPVQLTVNGLPQLQNKERYYLMVWQGGKPVAFCGSFLVAGSGPTTVTFNVAYKITKSTRWVVTRMAPGAKFPGHVVMTTS
jgi:hypothetical protein